MSIERTKANYVVFFKFVCCSLHDEAYKFPKRCRHKIFWNVEFCTRQRRPQWRFRSVQIEWKRKMVRKTIETIIESNYYKTNNCWCTVDVDCSGWFVFHLISSQHGFKAKLNISCNHAVNLNFNIFFSLVIRPIEK